MIRIPTGGQLRRCAAALLAAACLQPAMAQTGDRLPDAPAYLGEIRRGQDGKLIVTPSRDTAIATDAGNAPGGLADDANRRVIRVGSGEKVTSISEAARIARDGDIVEIAAGEYRQQPAVWTQDNLILRGLGHVTLIADGQKTGDKAIWLMRGGAIRIEGIEFRGARDADGDGAGLRVEKGRLSVLRCAFFDNEVGILTSDSPDLSLEIRDSEFGRAPKHAGALHHLLQVGRIARLTVTGSRFQQGFRGHLISSRARESRVLYNLILDGPQGQAAYELDFPNGGLAYVIGNVIGQSDRTEDATIVAYGAEGATWPENALYLAHNSLINEGAWGNFLKVWTDNLPADAEVWAINNLTIGHGLFPAPARGRFEGNQSIALGRLVDYAGFPLKLPSHSPLRGAARPPGRARDLDLMPTAEFVFPAGTRAIQPRSAMTPGAFQ